MALTPNKNTGVIGTSITSGESFGYIAGAEIQQGWLVGIAVSGEHKGKVIPVPEAGAETKPLVRVLGFAENYAPEGGLINVNCAVALYPLAEGELADDASVYLGATCYAWDHSTITVAGKTAAMAPAGIIRAIDPQDKNWVWVDFRLAAVC